MTKGPVIVLVPGGFTSPKAFAKLQAVLDSEGYESVVAPLTVAQDLSATAKPGSEDWKALAEKGIDDEVKALQALTQSYIDAGKEILLVGHSYGSVPAMLSCNGLTTTTRSAKGLEGGIKGLVYIAGFTHAQRGKNAIGSTEMPPLMPYHTLEEGLLSLQSSAAALFFSDVPSEDQIKTFEEYTLKYQSRHSFAMFPDYIDSDVDVPKTWIYTEKDETVSPQYQDLFIAGGKIDEVLKVNAGHFPYLTKPEETGALLIKAANREN